MSAPPDAPRCRIFSDGSCRGARTPEGDWLGPGGWGTILLSGKHEREMYGGDHRTTSNRMELTAAIMGLEALTKGCNVEVISDSRYVIDNAGQHLIRWKRTGWMTGIEPIKNQDLWIRLDASATRHTVKWTWVKGHNLHPLNERADDLAKKGRDKVEAQRPWPTGRPDWMLGIISPEEPAIHVIAPIREQREHRLPPTRPNAGVGWRGRR